MFLVKWCDMWLAPFGWMGSDESRTHNEDSAMKFKTEAQAVRRIERVMKLRDCERNEFTVVAI